MKILKNNKFLTKFFVVASVGSFFVLLFTFSFLSLKYSQVNLPANYNLIKSNNFGDPLITRNPNSEEVLQGPIINEIDPSLGPDKAPVIITYFADYECRFCREQESFIKGILEKYRDKVRLIWKDYPENDFSSKSYLAAVAGRCAEEQGEFWSFQNLIYDNEKDFSEELAISLAENMGLRKGLFSECLQDAEVYQLIKNNIIEARALDITGVPFVFINNQEVMGEATEGDLERIIDLELNKM
jgi:protein-disulfide isomerase